MAIENPRRLWATTCLAVAVSVVVLPASPASAKPSPAAVAAAKKKLVKLNEQTGQLVEKYNGVNEDLKAAKKKLKASKAAAAREQVGFEDMRKRAAQMAATAYKNGESGDVTAFVSAGDPQAVLDQAAVISHLSKNRASQLSQFLIAAQRVQRQQAQAQDAYDKVAAKAKELRTQKAKIDRSIAAQRKLIRQAGSDPMPRGSSGGGSYTGSASGKARVALQFAAAQLGKPYVYGATGPNSYDCSGLTMRAWGAAGVDVGRNTYAQHAATVERGRGVPFDQLQPGDLVFFNGLGHMGIYEGGGNMIHAPRTGKNVERVSITSGYYRQNFVDAGRP